MAKTETDAATIERLVRNMLKGEFSSLTISFNDMNAPNYMTVAQALEAGGLPEEMWSSDFISDAEQQKAIDTNSWWSIQWYPLTPNCFCRISASTLTALVQELEEEYGKD